MNKKHSEWIQVVGIIAVLLFISFTFCTSIDFFTDGEISCRPLKKVNEIVQNEFQFTMRCYIK
ncbi:MAG: hypothetical protein HRU07_00125 [Nitrosopumilus sp.]|nr:hypothetical protein [Nitrosopumilus sp.]NRA04587.1 hypothetical protein [Nitrosopumilus sp.]